MDTASDESLKIIRAVVLLFLLAMSLIGNSLVIFAIAVSSKRSQNPFNAYLLSMAAFGVLECTLTISFATGNFLNYSVKTKLEFLYNITLISIFVIVHHILNLRGFA